MKVKELIEHLQSLHGELEVHFAYNYGDHWRTMVASVVQVVDVAKVGHSAYHGMDKVLDEDSADWEKGHDVVCLSTLRFW